MKLSPAENRREREEQQHRIQQNETTDGSVRILAQNHKRNKPDGQLAEVQLLCRVICERDAHGAESRVEDTHEGVIQVFWVCFARFEFEGAVIACEVAGETDEHFAQGRVDIEVKFAFEVVRSELAETVRSY